MSSFTTLSKFLMPILLVVLVVGGFWSYSNRQTNTRQIKALQQETKRQKSKEKEAKEEVQQLSQKMEDLYTEKNGTANDTLVSATKQLFSSVYTYHTDREEESVKARKNNASKLASENALDGLFPKDADKSKPSVSTVSRMTKDPEIYLMPSDNKQLTALVVIYYAVSIAESEAQTGTFMYKIEFNPLTNQFTYILNVGEVNIP